MSLLQQISRQRGALIFTLLIVFVLASVYLLHSFYSDKPEIALVVGEPYEAMRQRSSADIDPHLPGKIWHNIPKTDARLRFIDPKYGFVTPPARFFAVLYADDVITSVRMSPQIEPLPYDDAIKIVLDLQDQWRKTGWIMVKGYKPLVNTPELHENIRRMKGGAGTTYWQAGDQYQIKLNLRRFKDDRHPDEERYLITLVISKPW
ncbi:hypothetical protein [Xenorhabdus bovienii]|uniref:hypothetical protein n=1 Tax=Xenorhabdus bovienii TaxID=40576 RepID=UPI00237C897C|nr:hypothetical protein [Xenorhabdus bovienii]MDE1484475.1 hypothetical protein [Xenorhabdus bovienii]MDE9432812.1 hypothetical protein [Xenorhabdus bovienii]MDE9443667.1 hypothetical protein [Xenorhabdus bovienii]MDE9463268.1 hypothetical protein [Xenorhabdus bovienii]MDE9471061.1 hypothetical protein [Xenorhabdus bovienii]